MTPAEQLESRNARVECRVIAAAVVLLAIVLLLTTAAVLVVHYVFPDAGSDAPLAERASRVGSRREHSSTQRPVVPAETSRSCPVLCGHAEEPASRRLLNSWVSKISAYGTQAVAGDAPAGGRVCRSFNSAGVRDAYVGPRGAATICAMGRTSWYRVQTGSQGVTGKRPTAGAGGSSSQHTAGDDGRPARTA
jgi:hypothetical protein